MKRGATVQFGDSPWSRAALMADEDRAIALAHEAQRLGVNVVLRGRDPRGPWTVRILKGARNLVFRGRDIHETIQFGLERWAAGADDSRVQWLAGPDQVGHAQVKRGRPSWTLCLRPALDERFKHPESTRCRYCWQALDRKAVAA